MSRTLCLFFLGIFLTAGPVFAQRRSRDTQTSLADRIIKAEEDIQLLKLQEESRDLILTRSTEQQVRSILDAAPDTACRAQLEEDLDWLDERLALHDLLVATLYMGRSHAHRGAESRLLNVVQKYPKFSRMDEVYFRLGIILLQDELPRDASVYLWKLVCNYPGSEFANKTFEQLNLIGFTPEDGCK